MTDRFDGESLPDTSGQSVEERFEKRVLMAVPDRHNPKLQRLMELINEDDELYCYWVAANVTAIERLGMTDHGPVHVKIVMNIAVRMLRLLEEAGVLGSVVTNYAMEQQDAEVVVALAALMHDIGMSIHREGHEEYSLFLAHRKLSELLPQVYDPRTATLVRADILHAIIAHRSGGKPLTVEAGVVRIADALDIAKGRSRIPFEAGSHSIHSVSAAAIEGIQIVRGGERPIKIVVEMSNSAGVFQLDQLFRHKLKGSGVEDYVEVEATVEGETEKSLLKHFRI
jgi:metal-dependent HD superfamily phosphatase/phosphodiesterase